jgi:nucleoside-diphosphate-sugar epimerase
MKKLGIIGCGWLGNHIAERLSDRYEIFATTTSESKIEEFNSKGYFPTLVSFSDETSETMKEWEVAQELDAIVISIPFSGIRGKQISMKTRRENVLKFLGDYKGQLFLTSSTGVYPELEKEYSEEDQPMENVESENFVTNKFPNANILRLAGLMGGQRLLKNYNISNLDQLVNHIHYADICSVIEKMLDQRSQGKIYNLAAPVHPNKEEVINAQKDLPYLGERTEKGRLISPAKLISELDFEFQYPDPRYFHH